MSLYYKGLPAHMNAYMSERDIEGFLGRLQAIKNKVVMQSEIDNEDVGDRLAQLDELKRAALERRAGNKQPKVGQIGMSEQDKQIIEAAKKELDPAYDFKRFAQGIHNRQVLKVSRALVKADKASGNVTKVMREMQKKSVKSRISKKGAKEAKEAKEYQEGKPEKKA